MNERSYRVGVDVGGSHITGALFDSPTSAMIQGRNRRASIHTHGEKDVILAEFAEVLKQVAGEHLSAVSSIGFAFPGPSDYEEGICLIPPALAKYEKLYGVNIRTELTQRLDFHGTMHFMNDAACFAIAKAWDWFVPALKRDIGDSVQVTPAELGEAAQMIGAAFIA